MTNRELLLEKYGVEMWTDETIVAFRKALLDWYDAKGRDHLPWRLNQDPYRIWVSEIMLQQTQVNTVIPYFNRFVMLFPSIRDLAKADEEVLLKAWEGLGYYSRVRNMQIAARQVMADYDGVFPIDPSEIIKLKGIGPYTCGAISSMAFGLPEPAVDGNVMRVFSRLFEIGDDIAKPATRKLFELLVRIVIDPERPGILTRRLWIWDRIFVGRRIHVRKRARCVNSMQLIKMERCIYIHLNRRRRSRLSWICTVSSCAVGILI